jgi:uncharacterized protein (DUF4415 family)
MSNIRRASLEELKAMKDRGEIAAPAADAQPVALPEGFWDDAEVQMPKAKKPISMRVDPDILDYFKAQEGGHLTRMHAVLRAYVDAHKKMQAD